MPRLVTDRLCLVPLDTWQLAACVGGDDVQLTLPGLGSVHFGHDHLGSTPGLYPLLLAATPHPGEVPGTWTVVHVDDRKAVGTVGAKGQVQPDGSIEIGYGIVSSYRGRGLATEAVREVCRALFAGDTGLAGRVGVVRAETRTDNLASQGVLRRCGFVVVDERLDDHDGPLVCWELTAST